MVLKKLLLVCVIALALIVPGAALAQTSGVPDARNFPQALNDAGENLEKFNFRVLLNSGEAFNCAAGVIRDCGAPADSSQDTTYVPRQNTAFGFGMRMIGLIHQTKPVSSTQYFADLGQRLHLISPAYAAGQGYTILSPVLAIWKVFRNVSYLIFVIFFIVVGFMIMFRSKLNPQTVIGIQHALPQIIVALLLVTFSYAIAGLMVDIANLSNRVVYEIFTNVGGFRTSCGNAAGFQLDCFGTQLWHDAASNPVPMNIFSLMMNLNRTEDIGNAIKGILSAIDIDIPGIGTLGGVIFSITLIGAIFRAFFALISAYVGIVITTILSPFQLLFLAIPGGKEGLSSLIKTYLSNVLVFPATFALLILAAYILNANEQPWLIANGASSFSWYPLPLGRFAVPGPVINNLLAFGILILLPNIPQVIKENMQVKEKIPVGSSLEGLRSAASKIPVIGQFLG